MMPEAKAAEVFNKFYRDPDGDELAGDGNELEKEPEFSQLHFFDHAPGIIKWDQCFPGCYPSLPEHTVHTDMPAYRAEDQNYPAYTHNSGFRKCRAVKEKSFTI